ncbi:Nucleotidyl transferase of uncharacterised function (DUF1814) [Klebsiella pneumoniae]|nr:Nucleotidyl transferase of uncharacterised function (DUF1814) [Klebsiella pneumoniae]
MDIQAPYYRQVALLMQVLPYVAVEREFALKGGTAINLFIRDFPRLSVDIDLAWVPLESRAIALPHIRDALARIAANLQQQAGMSAVLQANRSDEMRVIVTTDSANKDRGFTGRPGNIISTTGARSGGGGRGRFWLCQPSSGFVA